MFSRATNALKKSTSRIIGCSRRALTKLKVRPITQRIAEVLIVIVGLSILIMAIPIAFLYLCLLSLAVLIIAVVQTVFNIPHPTLPVNY